MTDSWGWMPTRMDGIWRHGPIWLRPIATIAPWAAVGLCLAMLVTIGGTMTMASGVLFDLPRSGSVDGEVSSMVALVTPMRDATTVFFDDARYHLNDGTSVAALGEHLADSASRSSRRTLLVLADRRVPYGDIATLAALARERGISRVLFADQRTEEAEK